MCQFNIVTLSLNKGTFDSLLFQGEKIYILFFKLTERNIDKSKLSTLYIIIICIYFHIFNAKETISHH